MLYLALQISTCMLSMSILNWVYTSLNPRKRSYIELRCVAGQEYKADYPHRVLCLLHAIFCSIVGTTYAVHLIDGVGLDLARVYVSSFMIYETYIFVEQWVTALKRGRSVANTGQPKVSLRDPRLLLVHHVITILAFWMVAEVSSDVIVLLYLLGEIPLVAVQLAWFYNTCPWFDGIYKESAVRFYRLTSVTLYFVIRVVGFCLVGFTSVLPYMNWSNPVSYITSMLLLGIYCLSTYSWYAQVQRMYNFRIRMDSDKLRLGDMTIVSNFKSTWKLIDVPLQNCRADGDMLF